MNIKHFNKQTALALACVAGISFSACSDNDLDNTGKTGDRGAAVSYIVSNAQNGTHRPAASRALPVVR